MTALSLHRLARWFYDRGVPFLPRLIDCMIYLIFNAVIPVEIEIGEGTHLAYGGMGVALHPGCRIGKNVLIAPQVSVGGRSPHRGLPVIEDECCISLGARILGPIRVGAGSLVCANAVVIRDVPPRSIVGGVPARLIRTDIDISRYRDGEGRTDHP